MLAVALARPSLWLVVCVLAGLVLRRRWISWLGVVPLVALVGVPIDAWVAAPLEGAYPPLREMPARVDGILVLGGADDLVISRDRGTPGLNAAAERMTEAVALARRYPRAMVVYSGGAVRQGWSEAQAARIFFAGQGLEGRVVYEDRSRTTWENAVFSRERLGERGGERWVLVTSALHMKRAMAAFAAAGWTGLLPDPVAYRSSRHPAWGASEGVSARLSVLDAAVHEWFGLLVYRIRGEAVVPPTVPLGA